MFAVLLTGPPGAGKTVVLTALSDALVAGPVGSPPRHAAAGIVAREPPGWFGLEYLLEEAEYLHRNMPELDGVHLVLDTERLGSTEIGDRIRPVRPDELSRGSTDRRRQVAP